MASFKAFVASSLAAVFLVAAMAGIVTPQNTPLKPERPRVTANARRRSRGGPSSVSAAEEMMKAATARSSYAAARSAPVILSQEESSVLLHPGLIERMERDATVGQYVRWTYEAARSNGLDGHMLANQFWQESRYDAEAESSHGAMGIAQIMQMHQGRLKGLDSRSDFFNARKSINAGAQLMGQLTRKYGDQSLALVAYNGGGKAISYVEGKTGHQATVGEWMKFMARQREQQGTSNHSAWHVQTYHYVRQIDPVFWPQALKARAEQVMKKTVDGTAVELQARKDFRSFGENAVFAPAFAS